MENFIIFFVLLGFFIYWLLNPTRPEKDMTSALKTIRNTSADYLKTFYFKRANKHRSKLTWRVFLLIVLPVANILLTFLFPPRTYDEFTPYSLIASLLYSLLILLYVTYHYVRKTKNLLPKSTFVEINKDLYREIWDVCYGLMSKLNLKEIDLKIYYVKTNAIDAHITLEGSTAHLFLSRSLISHSHNSLKEFESILGHEFGHIYQGDSKLFLITKNVFEIPLAINSILLGLNCILIIFAIPNGVDACIPILSRIIILLLYHRLFKGMGRLRVEAELLADLCSLIIVQDSQITKIVKKYLPEHISDNYPSKTARLECIEIAAKQMNTLKLRNPSPAIQT